MSFLNQFLKNNDFSHQIPIHLQGGNPTQSNDIKGGSFPPIYKCDKEADELIKKQQSKKREYETHKQAISIKDIMKMRRKKI